VNVRRRKSEVPIEGFRRWWKELLAFQCLRQLLRQRFDVRSRRLDDGWIVVSPETASRPTNWNLQVGPMVSNVLCLRRQIGNSAANWRASGQVRGPGLVALMSLITASNAGIAARLTERPARSLGQVVRPAVGVWMEDEPPVSVVQVVRVPEQLVGVDGYFLAEVDSARSLALTAVVVVEAVSLRRHGGCCGVDLEGSVP
jgi:hypothetical protein